MRLELLIMDANVLIDFCKTDRSVLTLVAEYIGTIHVAEQVLNEVKDLDPVMAKALGLCIVHPELALLTHAANAAANSPLRFQDWICLLLAERESWTCVTNDKRLRVECQGRTVAVIWGLQLVLRLVHLGALSASQAIELAEAMHAVNRRIPREVLRMFIRKVRMGR